MKVRASILNPKDIEIGITLVMPLKDWKEFAGNIKDKWPGSEIAREINSMVFKLERIVSGDE